MTPRCDGLRMRGTSLLEAVVALGIGSLALAAAAEQIATCAAYAHEARLLARAMNAARAVLDSALAAPCAPFQAAETACDPAFACTIAARALGTRAGETGPLDVVHVEVSVTAAGGETVVEAQERTIARFASVAARPQGCG